MKYVAALTCDVLQKRILLKGDMVLIRLVMFIYSTFAKMKTGTRIQLELENNLNYCLLSIVYIIFYIPSIFWKHREKKSLRPLVKSS